MWVQSAASVARQDWRHAEVPRVAHSSFSSDFPVPAGVCCDHDTYRGPGADSPAASSAAWPMAIVSVASLVREIAQVPTPPRRRLTFTEETLPRNVKRTV